MALNHTVKLGDLANTSASKRNWAKPLVGEFTLDLECIKYRDKIFLARNMSRVLAFHDKSRASHDGKATRRASSRHQQSRATTECFSSGPGKSLINGVPALNGVANGGSTIEMPLALKCDHDTSKPAFESMSQDTLLVSKKSDQFDAGHRRSLRRQLEKQHESNDAHLFFDLCNVRKKLNFKTNRLLMGERPSKRIRREGIKCHCHVTIWNNSPGIDQSEPVIRQTELCEITTSGSVNGTDALFVDIKLENPFIIRSRDLRVPIKQKADTFLEMGQHYFLEIKILPIRSEVDWPPFPVLGRSEGDQSHGIGHLAAEKLQGALIARYQHLPEAPKADTPLSVFYMHEGRLHRSKYGLEVNSKWMTSNSESFRIKEDPEATRLKHWAFDENELPFGRAGSIKKEPDIPKPLPKPQPKLVKLIFELDPAKSKSAPKDCRKCSLHGFQCPICPRSIFNALELLQFHLLNMHHKYKFVVDKEHCDPITGEPIQLNFRVIPIDPPRSKNGEREAKPAEEWVWQAPEEAFDLPAQINGEQNWVVGAQNKKKPSNMTQRLPILPDPESELRKKHGGFLPAQHVLPFRKATRKKHNNVKLRILVEDRSALYSSISHRQIRLSEEPRSETDDEIDDKWFIEKYMETLDIVAARKQWSEEERQLRKKWDTHRLKERLEHPRFLSDCLIRFVKVEKEWLKNGNVDLNIAFAQFLGELQTRRVINQNVLDDVWAILHSNDVQSQQADSHGEPQDVIMSEERPGESVSPELTSELTLEVFYERYVKDVLSLPPLTCHECKRAISHPRAAIHCSQPACDAPASLYHTKCAGVKHFFSHDWNCGLCKVRMKMNEIELSKEKESKLNGHQRAAD